MDQTRTMLEPLQEWANKNAGEEEGCWRQVKFIRDKIPGIAFRAFARDSTVADMTKSSTYVVSTHVSGGVLLPVYMITLPGGATCVLRYNFFDWKVTVRSEHTVDANFLGLFNESERWSSCYCEGFPENWVGGSYSDDPHKFTVSLSSEHELFMFLWILLRHLAEKVSIVKAA